MVEEALKRFEGEIMQVPPAFSACKTGGKRAYDIARQGGTPDLQAKPLRIDEITLTDCRLDCAEPEISIRVVCSKGTYIRALARDIGEALGSGAHLTALRRTRVGDYGITDCQTLEAFEQWLGTIEVETELPEN